MDSVKVQIILYWISVGFYAVATILLFSSTIFGKGRFLKPSLFIAAAGFVAHTAALILRWKQTGHFPYWGTYEVFASYAWGAVAFYLIVQLFRPNLKILGALVLPLSFIMIGIAVMTSTEVKEIPRTFFTYWLGIHILFAKLSYGSALIAAGLGILYLLKESSELRGQVHPLLEKLPDIKKLDYLNYRFVVFAFIMLLIMIASGSVWAYKAWGRYWGWDPIETWAFISWLVYGFYLHLRITYRWQGKRSAWMSIFCLLLVLFAFFGIPLIYPSVHEHLKYSGLA
ncbi:c-type cytochrome biogenesis protein CcsB [Thermincola ferriacetica]